MYNYRIEAEYDGGRYDGWQRLGKDASTNTIENKLTEIISRMTGETVEEYIEGYEISFIIIGNKNKIKYSGESKLLLDKKDYFTNEVFGLESKK